MTTSAVSHVPPSRPSSVLDFLDGALVAPREGRGLVVASVPCPVAPLETLLGAFPGEEAFLWHPPEGPAYATLGAVETLRADGTARMPAIRAHGTEIFGALSASALGEAPPPYRCFGGFSFDVGSAQDAPWTAFGDAHFTFPRFTYGKVGDQAFLTVATQAAELRDARQRAQLLARADLVLGALRAASTRSKVSTSEAARRALLGRRDTAPEEWSALVERARAAIAAGAFEKVVVARRADLRFDGALEPSPVLAELALGADPTTRFATRFGSTTFLGATPERLVRRRGLDIDTEALAGSNRPGDAQRATELLASSKERLEHGPVLREIVRALSPLCESLEYPGEPEVRTLRHILHLRTPIRARLARPAHVLELVERLHPTPAVGGTPTRDAVRFIAEHERSARGWYASPVGWFDAEGNGEFVVALRSGVLDGEHAYLYAGGGIVGDSDPASEYEETRLKLATLSQALHVAQ